MIGFFKKIFLKKLISVDKFGNSYYQQEKQRWVVYNGTDEPSKIPPQYYLWLHYSIDKLEEKQRYKWERDRISNLTGTKLAYLPDGHILKSPFALEKKDYTAWNPDD